MLKLVYMERRKGKIDLLSGLPDEILLHILSFLRTKRSVCTSVLSKRWRFLWAHVPNLKFYPHSNFIADIDTQPHPLDIIIRVAMIHQAQILNTFKLKLSNVEGWSSYQLDTLIIYLLTNRNPRNLYLDLGYKECEDDIVCTLPRLLFACKTLVDLRLVNCGEIPSSGEMFLPRLKKLNLSYVDYEDDESLPRLISGCPLLEELIVNVCVRYEQTNTGCVIVSSPTLKLLTVDFSDLGEECPDEMLVIDVPALEYLTVDHCNLDSLKSLEKNMNSLVEAKISLNGCSHTCGTDCTDHGRSIEFLSCLCCVSYLRISSDFGETLVDIVGTGSMPKFDNLTKLKLKLTVDWYKVVKFLELADNLEVLLISLYKVPPYTEPKRVATCMLLRLRTVTLYCFGACDDAFELVRYILRNARALEKMEIYAEDGSSDKDNFDALRRISLFERGSTSCQLDFNNTKHCVHHISNEVTIRQLICKFKSIFIW